MGLQHKSLDKLSSELKLEARQVLANFNKLVVKVWWAFLLAGLRACKHFVVACLCVCSAASALSLCVFVRCFACWLDKAGTSVCTVSSCVCAAVCMQLTRNHPQVTKQFRGIRERQAEDEMAPRQTVAGLASGKALEEELKEEGKKARSSLLSRIEANAGGGDDEYEVKGRGEEWDGALHGHKGAVPASISIKRKATPAELGEEEEEDKKDKGKKGKKSKGGGGGRGGSKVKR